MPSKRAQVADEGPSKAWLDSYADAMTLLLAFFILLFAFSLVDEEKFTEFKFGVHQAFGRPYPTIEGGAGILDKGNGVAELVASPPAIPREDQGVESESLIEMETIRPEDVDELLAELTERVAALGAADFVTLEGDPRGVVVRMDSRVLFRSGSALILPDGVSVLTTVADVLAGVDNLIIVEGHTDNVPTGGGTYATNWELSTARSTSVLRYLIELEGLEAPRLSSAGFADTRPRALNDTADNRARNRRVELVVLVDPEVVEATETAVEDLTIPGVDGETSPQFENPVGLPPLPSGPISTTN